MTDIQKFSKELIELSQISYTLETLMIKALGAYDFLNEIPNLLTKVKLLVDTAEDHSKTIAKNIDLTEDEIQRSRQGITNLRAIISHLETIAMSTPPEFLNSFKPLDNLYTELVQKMKERVQSNRTDIN